MSAYTTEEWNTMNSGGVLACRHHESFSDGTQRFCSDCGDSIAYVWAPTGEWRDGAPDSDYAWTDDGFTWRVIPGQVWRRVSTGHKVTVEQIATIKGKNYVGLTLPDQGSNTRTMPFFLNHFERVTERTDSRP